MNVSRWIVSVLTASVLVGPAWSQVGISVGVGVRPYGWYRPYGCYRPYGYGWGPPIVVGVGAPVVYPPPPVVQPVVVAAPPPVQVVSPPAAVQVPVAAAVPPANQAEIERCTAHLVNPNESARTAAVVQLGRLHATQAIEQMSRVLTTDRSPSVREAAARGLGLVGSPAALPALQQAAQADENAEVRNSARFAVETIRSQNP